MPDEVSNNWPCIVITVSQSTLDSDGFTNFPLLHNLLIMNWLNFLFSYPCPGRNKWEISCSGFGKMSWAIILASSCLATSNLSDLGIDASQHPLHYGPDVTHFSILNTNFKRDRDSLRRVNSGSFLTISVWIIKQSPVMSEDIRNACFDSPWNKQSWYLRRLNILAVAEAL